MKKNCYWYVDSRLPRDQQVVSAMCEECHKTNNFGAFWSASRGYGKWKVDCKLCNTVIFDETGEEKGDETETGLQDSRV